MQKKGTVRGRSALFLIAAALGAVVSPVRLQETCALACSCLPPYWVLQLELESVTYSPAPTVASEKRAPGFMYVTRSGDQVQSETTGEIYERIP